MSNVRIAAAAFLIGFLLEATPTAQPADILVTVDASSIPDGTVGFLDFQFNVGGPGAQSATAIVSNFVSSNLAFGSISFDGAASGGPLPADVTILNDPNNLVNGILQSVTFGSNSSFSFIVSLTGPALTTPGDRDSTFFLNLVGPGPNYDSLFPDALPHLSITIPQDGSGSLVIDSVSQITAVVVPEPRTAVLAIASGLILAMRFRRSGVRR